MQSIALKVSGNNKIKCGVFFFRYVMKYLEMSGVNFNAVDKNLQTALHICCVHGHVDAFKFLIKAEVIFMKHTFISEEKKIQVVLLSVHVPVFICVMNTQSFNSIGR